MNHNYGSILVVDDNVVIRQILRASLEAEGHYVQTVSSSLDALTRMRQGDFDLILLDVIMPDIDGIELLNIMGGDEKLSNIPVIVISGDDQRQSAIRCIELGAVDYLGKPINTILLKARVQACLQKKQLTDQTIAYQQELEEMNAALQKANNVKSDFVAFIAHELRTPLTSLWMYKDLLPRMGELNPKQAGLLQTMAQSLERMRLLVSDLDDLSKNEQGNLKISKEPVNLSRIVQVVLQDLRHHIDAKGQNVRVNIAEKLPLLHVDRNRLMQILINLIMNASKYTLEGGRIEITAVPDPLAPSFVQITVHDNGIGISREAQSQIFDKFFRVQSPYTESIPGSGLGLNITKILVEKHGGAIWVKSDGSNGTTFFVTLPILEPINWSQSLVDDTVQMQSVVQV